MLGFLFAILSAASFGLNAVNIRRGTLTGSAGQAIYVTVILGTPLFFITALVAGQVFQISDISPRDYLLFASAGVLHFIIGRYFSYRAINAIGANRAAPLQSMAMVISVVLAIVLLGEEITIGIIAGIVMILVSPAIIFQRKNQADHKGEVSLQDRSSDTPSTPSAVSGSSGAGGTSTVSLQGVGSGMVLRQAEGYLFGFLAASVWGITPIMIRAALLESNLSLLGGLVSYVAAFAVLMLSFGLPGRLSGILSMDRRALRWFSQAAVSGTSAQIFWYLALGVIPVTIAAPLQRTTALFILFFSFLVNRRIESFGMRVILGVALSVAGSIALAF